MTRQCPASAERVGATSARAAAWLVVFCAAMILATGAYWGLIPLAADFGLRAVGPRRFSPLARAASLPTRVLRLADPPTDGAPKRFAAGVGLAFSLAAATLGAVGQPTAAALVLGVLGACALLEAAAGFCLACRLHPYLFFFRRAPRRRA